MLSKKRILIFVVNGILRMFGKNNFTLISSILSEEITPVIDIVTTFGKISFYCHGEVPLIRARTLLTKEPETILWIDDFNKDDVFWDVGANIGPYSLYAAKRGLAVFSFEPSAANYYLLNKNIELNSFTNVKAFCLAFNDEVKCSTMNMSNTGFGFAHSSFECSVDQHGEKYKPVFQQGMLGFGIDAFIELFSSIEDAQGSFEFPSHIKIDVDGNEEKIINGAINTLSDNRLKTLLVELDFSRSEMVKSVIKRVEQCGLSLTHRPDHGMGNAIFYRNNV